MAATLVSKEKTTILAKLEKLLDVAGIETSWEMLSDDMRKLQLRSLRALLYRIERARAESYENGEHNSGGTRDAAADMIVIRQARG